ncbi:MAG TPA: RdgB/HAM1 family non-canonical purine NTP pyrophosphatase [Acholeplasmataceae bacterium]|jgi:XTP/dITP diphosphohydrolase|nr:RdgB/HAM1 family non-canonical purine NTP pyrophosphatase [Acholeplasmataceae bacterium]
MELIFASHNPHKLSEVRAILSDLPVVVTDLKEIGADSEVEETGTTFRENARIKAEFFYKKFKKPVFADDSGLIVTALGGEPGVHSARYAGEHGNHYKNNLYLLEKMQGITERDAYFLTVICFFDNTGQAHFFEGRLNGEIAYELKGSGGFGYDPVFYLPEYNSTLAEMGVLKKNQLSHRYLALKEFAKYLKKEVG